MYIELNSVLNDVLHFNLPHNTWMAKETLIILFHNLFHSTAPYRDTSVLPYLNRVELLLRNCCYPLMNM